MSLVHQDSVNVQINDNSVVDDGYVQMMPFTIEHNGAAKVDEYFTYERESNVKVSSFRGRPLEGVDTSLPEGYTGLVLKESASSCRDDTERRFLLQQKFKSFTQWALDSKPTADNSTVKALDWIKLAHVLHNTDD